MNKSLKIFLIIILTFITIILAGLFIFFLTNKGSIFNHINHKVSKDLVFNKIYNTDFKKISINSKASDIEINNGKENEIKVIIYGNKKKMKVADDENYLNITLSSNPCIGFCFNTKIDKIEIYLPSSYNNDIELKNKYGDVNIGKFIDLNLEANMNSGDILIDQVKNANIKNTYGDIKINNSTKDLNIEVNSGDIEIAKVDKLKVSNKYGDIKINSVTSYLNIKEDCGDIQINSINLDKNSKIVNSYGDIEINSTNEIYIDAKTSLGDKKINNNYQKSDVILNIKNSCGDIEVNN